MKFALAAFSIVALIGAIGMGRAPLRRTSAQERALAFRFTAFVWLVCFLLLLAFIFLPNKGRVLLMVPAFLISASLVKWWRNSRRRLRQAAQQETNFERARRVN